MNRDNNQELITEQFMRNEITCYDDKVETVSKKSNEKLLFCEVLNPSIQ